MINVITKKLVTINFNFNKQICSVEGLNIFFDEFNKFVDILLTKINQKENMMEEYTLEKISSPNEILEVFNKNIDKINSFITYINNIVSSEDEVTIDTKDVENIVIFTPNMGTIGIFISNNNISLNVGDEKEVIIDADKNIEIKEY